MSLRSEMLWRMRSRLWVASASLPNRMMVRENYVGVTIWPDLRDKRHVLMVVANSGPSPANLPSVNTYMLVGVARYVCGGGILPKSLGLVNRGTCFVAAASSEVPSSSEHAPDFQPPSGVHSVKGGLADNGAEHNLSGPDRA